jgi:peptidyl-dipeptidase Dcp
MNMCIMLRHGLLSDVTYQRLAGTSVLRDFVELPSQLFEHWLSQREVLKRHARHHITGEPIPDELIDRMNAARRFNQGFETVEYTASALLDQILHRVPFSPEEAAPAVALALGSGPESSPAASLGSALGSEALSGSRLVDLEAEAMRSVGLPQGIVLRHRAPHFQRE